MAGCEEHTMPVADEVILRVEELTTRFHLKRGTLMAVDHVSFAVRRGETFGLAAALQNDHVLIRLEIVFFHSRAHRRVGR